MGITLLDAAIESVIDSGNDNNINEANSLKEDAYISMYEILGDGPDKPLGSNCGLKDITRDALKFYAEMHLDVGTEQEQYKNLELRLANSTEEQLTSVTAIYQNTIARIQSKAPAADLAQSLTDSPANPYANNCQVDKSFEIS